MNFPTTDKVVHGVHASQPLTHAQNVQAADGVVQHLARAASIGEFGGTRTVATSFTVADYNAPPSQRYNRMTINHAHAQVQDTMQTRRIYPAQARSAQAQGQHLNGVVLDRTGRNTDRRTNGKVLDRR